MTGSRGQAAGFAYRVATQAAAVMVLAPLCVFPRFGTKTSCGFDKGHVAPIASTGNLASSTD